MDNTTLLSTLSSWKNSIDSQITGQIAQKSVLDAAVTLLTNGYQSDQQTIADGISSGIASAVKDATDPLNTQIATLTEQLATANATIISLQSPSN